MVLLSLVLLLYYLFIDNNELFNKYSFKAFFKRVNPDFGDGYNQMEVPLFFTSSDEALLHIARQNAVII